MIKPLLTMMCLVAACSVQANDAESKAKRGIYWYEPYVSDKQDEQATKVYPKPVVPPLSEMMTMHPEQLRQLQQETLEYAVYTQKAEDAEANQRVVDAIRRKSSGYMSNVGYVTMTNPDLNPGLAFPINNPGRAANLKDAKNEVANSLASYRERFGIIMFSQKGCSACNVQRMVLDNFRHEYDWYVKEVDIFEHPMAQAKYGIDGTPITILVERDSEKWLPVAVGAENLSTLQSNIFRGARLLADIITPNQFYLRERDRGGYLDPAKAN